MITIGLFWLGEGEVWMVGKGGAGGVGPALNGRGVGAAATGKGWEGKEDGDGKESGEKEGWEG